MRCRNDAVAVAYGHPQIVPTDNETVETEQIMYRIFRFIGTMLLVVMDLLL